VEWLTGDEDAGALKDRMFANISSQAFDKQQQGRHQIRRLVAWAAAACLLIGLSAAGYFLLLRPAPQQIAQNEVHDIKPGGNKAILTLAGGKQVLLSTAKNGMIAKQGAAFVNKTASGQITYQAAQNAIPTPEALTLINTITTPRGGKWFVTLARLKK